MSEAIFSAQDFSKHSSKSDVVIVVSLRRKGEGNGGFSKLKLKGIVSTLCNINGCLNTNSLLSVA